MKERLIQYIKDDLSTYEMAKKENLSQTAIRYHLRKFGLKSTRKSFIDNKKVIIDGKALCKKHGLSEVNDKGKCKKCAVEYVSKRRIEVKKKAVEYKGGKCEMCEYDKCIDALEFHHLNPSEKEFSVGDYGHSRSWERVKRELDKCILVCANCHRELHSKKDL